MKTIAIKLLALLLVFAMVIPFAACADTGDEEVTTGSASSDGEMGDIPEEFRHELPELNYNGKKVTILHAKGSGRNDELKVEGDFSSNQVSSAVNERNLAVEQQLGVKLNVVENESADETAKTLQTSVNAADTTYQIAMNATFVSVEPAINGIYKDLSTVEHLNRSKHYWTQGYNEMMTFGQHNKQFLLTGPVAISMFRYMFLTVFNITEFGTHNIDVDKFYQDVKDGKWTLEYQKTLITQGGGTFQDNGDGETDDKDFYGFATGGVISVDPYMVASGIEMIVKDENTNALAFNGDAIRPLTELCAAVSDLYENKNTFFYADAGFDDIGFYGATEIFANKRAMMATTCFDGMETHLGKLKEIQYGIVPMPKYAENAEYQTYVQDQLSSLGIARSITGKNELSMLGAVLESLAFHSNKIVRPAYYENTLGKRVVDDPDSKEMLELMYDTMTFDFSSTCSNMLTGVVIRDQLRPMLSTNDKVTATIDTWRSKVTNLLTTINTSMNAV
jgi:hypothetical protein